MSSARRIYDLLAAVLKGSGQDFCLTDVMLGLNWSSTGIARTSTASELLATGMCFSPTGVSRQIPWAGSLRGRSCAELLPWLEHWSGPELVCAIATINAISSLANKTLPGLLALATQAQVVLMGPSLPWLSEWAEFGVDYLAGIRVNDAQLLRTIVAEGGGTRIFDQAVNYCVAAL